MLIDFVILFAFFFVYGSAWITVEYIDRRRIDKPAEKLALQERIAESENDLLMNPEALLVDTNRLIMEIETQLHPLPVGQHYQYDYRVHSPQVLCSASGPFDADNWDHRFLEANHLQ